MEGPSGVQGVCSFHGTQLASFTATFLPSTLFGLESRAEAEPILQTILRATDACPECRRKAGREMPRRISLASGTGPNLEPTAIVRVTCTRFGDGPWSCSWDASVKRKVLLVGDASAKKADLVRPCVFDEVSDNARDVLGAKIMSRHQTVTVPDEGIEFHVTFSLWDVTGHRISEKRRLRTYFRGAKTVIAVADLAEERSVEELGYWLSVTERILGKIQSIIVAKGRSLPDPLGIAEARLADLARRHRATVISLPAGTTHSLEHLFEALGEEAIHEVFATRWWPRMYA